MGLFQQVGEDQPLPVQVQLIRGAGGGDGQAAARFAGLQQQMHLRIVPQRLKVANALHRIGDGLPVADGPGAEADLYPQPLPDEPLQNFHLHLAHELGMDLPVVPDDVKLGVFLL